MRMTQNYGLKKEAVEFLEKNIHMMSNVVCPMCKEVVTHKKNSGIYKTEICSLGFKVELKQYVLKDERIVREVLNLYTPWSSGQCLFIDLVDENNQVLYGWTVAEIDVVI